MARLNLFGYPTVELGGSPLGGPVAQRHRLALLALLARAPRHSVPRDKLLAWLWPETDQANARHLLNAALHVIRRDLGDEVLVSRRDEVALSEAVQIDVQEFLNALAQGEAETAVSLYRAPFLDGFFLTGAAEFEQWVSHERERLTVAYREALEKLAELAEGHGDELAALRWWRALAHEDPYNSRVVGRLMLALERNGDHGNAIELGREHTERLRAELDAEPDAEFTNLLRRLQVEPNGLVLASQPDRSSPPTTGPGISGRARRFPSLGWGMAAVLVGLSAISVITFVLKKREPALLPKRAVVTHFENRTGNPALDPVGFMVADWIARGVIRTGLAEMVSSDEVLRSMLTSQSDSAIEGLALARRLAHETRARHVIGGSYYTRGDSIVFSAHVFDAENGRLLRAMDEVTGDPSKLGSVVNTVRDRVVGAVATLLDERTASWSDLASQPPSPEAYRLYAAGMENFLTQLPFPERRLKFAAAAQQFREAASLDSSFTAPLIWAVYAHWNGALGPPEDLLVRLEQSRSRMNPWDRAMADHVLAHSRRDWEGALKAAREVVRYAPDAEWNYKVAWVAGQLNRHEEAVQALQRINPQTGWIKNFPAYWTVLADQLHFLGQYREELEAVDGLRQQHPGELRLAFHEFRARVGLGQAARAVELAVAILDSGVATQPLSLLIRELRLHGYGRDADSLASYAVTRGPSRPQGQEAPGFLRQGRFGDMLREAGRIEEAKALFEELARADSVPPFNRVSYLSRLACILAQQRLTDQLAVVTRAMEEGERALPTIQRAIAASARAEIRAELGDYDEALELARESIRQYGNTAAFQHGSGFSVLLRNHAGYRRLMGSRE